MPCSLEWWDIAERLALAMVAGFVLGLNRLERGRPAGLRTLLLVTLAAAVAMVLTNLLLSTTGKSAESFSTMDPMRLPLGILTGMGFIGAGAIIRREGMILGVTTAATLWLATVAGLCFGGGFLVLGGVTTAIGMLALWGLGHLESQLLQDRRADVTVRCGRDGPSDEEIRAGLVAAGFWIISWEVAYKPADATECLLVRGEVGWHGSYTDFPPPPYLTALSRRSGVLEVRWKT